MPMARSIALAFDSFLTERVPSPAARASRPTASTPGRERTSEAASAPLRIDPMTR